MVSRVCDARILRRTGGRILRAVVRYVKRKKKPGGDRSHITYPARPCFQVVHHVYTA